MDSGFSLREPRNDETIRSESQYMTPPLRILGRASSINVRKVLWTCREIGIDYSREDFGAGFAPTNTPEFLAMNPNGMVPVREDEAGGLGEPNAIRRYPAGKYA